MENKIQKMSKVEKTFSKIIRYYFKRGYGMKPISTPNSNGGVSTLMHRKRKVLNNIEIIIGHNYYEENNIDRVNVKYGSSSISFDQENIIYGDLNFSESLVDLIKLDNDFVKDEKLQKLIKEFEDLKVKDQIRQLKENNNKKEGYDVDKFPNEVDYGGMH